MTILDPERIYRWVGASGRSLELLRLAGVGESVRVRSDVIDAGPSPFAVSYDWEGDPTWRTRSLGLRLRAAQARALLIERAGEARWRVDGVDRADLDGCDEIDLSITPFCNTLALRRFGPPPGGPGELTTLFIDLPSLAVAPSRQRYDRLAADRFRYVDIGRYEGFTAELTVDEDGMILSYAGLFERIGGP